MQIGLCNHVNEEREVNKLLAADVTKALNLTYLGAPLLWLSALKFLVQGVFSPDVKFHQHMQPFWFSLKLPFLHGLVQETTAILTNFQTWNIIR